MEDIGWRMEDGVWRMEDKCSRMEDGGYRTENKGGRRKRVSTLCAYLRYLVRVYFVRIFTILGEVDFVRIFTRLCRNLVRLC